MISIIVAVASNNAIGKDNDLLWHLPNDLGRFRKITTGHTVIMGKRTWESLPKRPLKDRRNMVLTDDPSDRFEGAVVVYSVDDVLAMCDPEDENFVIGGASVYRQFLPLCDRLYLTRVHKDFEGDVFFPQLDPADWHLVSREDFSPDEKNDFSYSYLVYDRNRQSR
jgi:dihydrofolate reductase